MTGRLPGRRGDRSPGQRSVSEGGVGAWGRDREQPRVEAKNPGNQNCVANIIGILESEENQEAPRFRPDT